MTQVSKTTFKYIVERVQNRLTGWRAKHLSLTGHCTLVNSLLAGIPTYVMQTAWLPQSTCDALNQLNRNFLLGSSYEKRKIHMVNWATVTSPKNRGGFGIREARTANLAQLAKLGTRLAYGTNDI